MKRAIVVFLVLLAFMTAVPAAAQVLIAPKSLITLEATDELTGKSVRLSEEDCISAVLLCYATPELHDETLKALAAACRSLLLYSTEHDLPFALYSTDKQYAAERYGAEFPAFLARVNDAAEYALTVDLLLDGERFPSVFHEVSSGATENGADIFGADFACLVSVLSARDRESGSYGRVVNLDDTRLSSLLGTDGDVGTTTTTETGAVLEMQFGEKTFTGTELSVLLGLGTLNFSAHPYTGGVLFTCRGRGHGVGMSIYGADILARDRLTAIDILNYYYPRADITA